ncbi:hypothetical protein CMU93_05515 [Elizabethkingia anophelis]|nr:hypothetical protein [Elizabethkingia anophelis]
MRKYISLTFILIFLDFLTAQTITLEDKFTSEKFMFEKTITWIDGGLMNDEKVDGVIYIKNNNNFYKRIFSGPVNVKWFGAKGDNTTNDTQAFKNALEFLKISIPPSQLKPYILFVPRGSYIVDYISWDYDGFQMQGEGALATVFKFTNKLKNVEAGIFPTNSAIDTSSKKFKFYTNVVIKDIGCDPSTIGSDKSFILIRNTYNFLIRNVSMLYDTFDEDKYALTVKDNSYTGSIENCDLPKVNIEGKNAWTITTLNFLNLRTSFIKMKNSLGISFIQPVIQGSLINKVQLENCNTITLMNGDIEDHGVYLNFIGNQNSNIRSYGNNILALKGKYTSGIVPQHSFFDDTGFIGIGDSNEKGVYGKFYIKNSDSDILSSLLSENRPTISVEGNTNSKEYYKFTYTKSNDGNKTWGIIGDNLKINDAKEFMTLSKGGNLLIGVDKDSGQRVQIGESLKLDLPVISDVNRESIKPDGYIKVFLKNEEVLIPYYKK